jgi:hypothetical protein
VKYSAERKEGILKKMMPPHNKPLSQLAEEEGISEATLYNWRNSAVSGCIFTCTASKVSRSRAIGRCLLPSNERLDSFRGLVCGIYSAIVDGCEANRG